MTWHRFDAGKLTVGDEVERPDLGKGNAVGLFIDRPINNRYILIDNLHIWAAPR